MLGDRADGAFRLAQELKGRTFHDLLVLAIPRGGVVTGAILAHELDAELDVVLVRKLRAPGSPELAIGAVAEDGQVSLNSEASRFPGLTDNYLVAERHQQMVEIARRRELIRAVRPPAPITGRSVVITDDGIATGSTMIAALRWVEAQKPHELIVAVPVASADRLREVQTWCDEVVCPLTARKSSAVSQFCRSFAQVEDEEVVAILRAFTHVGEGIATT